MKPSSTILITFLFTSGVLAVTQSAAGTTISNGNGNGNSQDCFSQSNSEEYCCINGQWSGPVYSSFEAAFTTNIFGSTGIFARTVATQRAELVGRAITSEVQPGLTCVGDAVSTVSSNASGNGGSITATSNPESTGASNVNVGTAVSTSNSKGVAPMITQAPVLIVGAAAALMCGNI